MHFCTPKRQRQTQCPSQPIVIVKSDDKPLPSNEMAGQQEVGYPLTNGILVSTVPACELALEKMGLHE